MWSVRELFNPVITRVLLYGANPFDNEYVLKRMEEINVISGKQIKGTWVSEWTKKADRYISLADKALEDGNKLSAEQYYRFATQCFYACYMINSDDIEEKRNVYEKLKTYYAKSLEYGTTRYEQMELEITDAKIPGYLLYPDQEKFAAPYPCVMIYAGIGSCKEELDMLARPLLERGIAAMFCDQPGTGAALFDYGVTLSGKKIDETMRAMEAYLTACEDIDDQHLAAYGLCMGGGYAVHGAVISSKVQCCVSLFPLFLGASKMDSIPLWMKQGKWSNFQYGNSDGLEDFLGNMAILEQGTFDADYFMVYSPDDNWMSTQASETLFAMAQGHKESYLLDDKPSFASEETIMHAMPVGEQLHWVKIMAADWIKKHI